MSRIDEEVLKLTSQNRDENESHRQALDDIRDYGWLPEYQSLLADLASDDLAAVAKFYHAGETVRSIKTNNAERDARRILNTFSATKKLNARLMTAAYKFSQEMADYVDRIQDLYNEELDYRVNQTHLQYVMVDYLDPEERLSYLTRAVNEGLSPIKLQKLIKAETGRAGGSGRAHQRPESREQLLIQIQEVAQKFIDKDSKVWSAPENPALLLLQNTEGVDEVLRSEVTNTLHVLTELKSICTRMIPVFQALDSKYLDAYLSQEQTQESSAVSDLRRVSRQTVLNQVVTED